MSQGNMLKTCQPEIAAIINKLAPYDNDVMSVVLNNGFDLMNAVLTSKETFK